MEKESLRQKLEKLNCFYTNLDDEKDPLEYAKKFKELPVEERLKKAKNA